MGWIKVHRKLQDHWLWKGEKFTKGQAWIDILMEVNHSEQTFLLGSSLRRCGRGESLNSVKTWARRWRWTESAVRRFFDLLESDGMISTKGDTQTTMLTVCNYDSYQETRRTVDEQPANKRRASGEQVETNKKGKKDKNDKEEIPESLLTISGFALAWEEWKQHRSEKKKPLTPTTVKKQFKFLSEQPDPVAVINQSIRNGWEGLFVLKNLNGQPAPKLQFQRVWK